LLPFYILPPIVNDSFSLSQSCLFQKHLANIGSAGRVLVAPDGNRQYLSLKPTLTPSHYKNRSGKFLKGVGKLLSRSFLTKTAPPCCSRHSTADFSLQEGGAKKNLSKRNADKRISRSAERAKGYSPLTSQAFEKA